MSVTLLVILALALAVACAGLLLRRRSRGNGTISPSQDASSASRSLDENVQFTVFRPASLEAGRWHTMLAFAHLSEKRADTPADEPDPVQEVQRQAAALLGDTSRYRQHTEDSLQAVPQQGALTFVPAADGIEFNPSSRAFDWTETVHREEFRMRAGQATAGRIIRGRLTVYLGAIVVAEIGMALRVGARASAATAESASDYARPYRKVFASYSHHDTAIVEEFAEYARAMGDKYLRDVIDLRSGEQWQPALEQLIKDADVFQLFWSWNAIDSPYVGQEWVYALSLKRRSFVRPVVLDRAFPGARGNTAGIPAGTPLRTDSSSTDHSFQQVRSSKLGQTAAGGGSAGPGSQPETGLQIAAAPPARSRGRGAARRCSPDSSCSSDEAGSGRLREHEPSSSGARGHPARGQGTPVGSRGGSGLGSEAKRVGSCRSAGSAFAGPGRPVGASPSGAYRR